jgi:hypothetical protein
VFTYLSKQGVRSNRGFDVQITGRFSIEYRENNRVLAIAWEAGRSNGKNAVLVDPFAFARWRDGTAITTHDQQRILSNFREAIEFQNLELVVESGFPAG